MLTSGYVDIYFEEGGIFKLGGKLLEEGSNGTAGGTPVCVEVEHEEPAGIGGVDMLVQGIYLVYLYYHLKLG